MNPYRTGYGFDAHQLVPGRKLLIGGVEIPHNLGAAGHSDADVLLHAIMDALLGAAALGDIGLHFPDSDPRLKGISSIILLERVVQLLKDEGFSIGNIDATVMLQSPHLGDHISAMRRKIAGSTGIALSSVSVKATTTEHLGIIGEGKGIASGAVVLICREADQQAVSG